MKYEFARFSNQKGPTFDPLNILFMNKGQNGVLVLSEGVDEPKEGFDCATKTDRIVLESYLRRPSLVDEAMEKICEFANDGILAMQTPYNKLRCATVALLIQKGKYRWLLAGDTHAYHFIDGQVVQSSSASQTAYFGDGVRVHPQIGAVSSFKKGENSFLICSDSFAKYITDEDMERTLSQANSVDQWLRMMKDLYEDRCQNGELFSAATLFVPNRKERPTKKKTAIIIAVVVILLLTAFFGLGALKKMRERVPMPPGVPFGDFAPGMPTPPAPPTMPPPPGGGPGPGN